MVLEQRCARTVYDEAYDAPREGRGVRRTFVAYSRAPEGLRTESLSLKDLGDVGEDLAAEYLESIGMSVVERKWRCGLGEVDIVAEDGGALVFVEVKTRREGSVQVTPELAVTVTRQKRYLRLAELYISRMRPKPTVRCDVVAVTFPVASGDEVLLRHVTCAFFGDSR